MTQAPGMGSLGLWWRLLPSLATERWRPAIPTVPTAWGRPARPLPCPSTQGKTDTSHISRRGMTEKEKRSVNDHDTTRQLVIKVG